MRGYVDRTNDNRELHINEDRKNNNVKKYQHTSHCAVTPSRAVNADPIAVRVSTQTAVSCGEADGHIFNEVRQERPRVLHCCCINST